SRRRHTRFSRDWSSDVCSSDLMSSGDERSGVLYVANRADGRPFGMDDIRLLQTYATQAAIVVESARLYAQEQTRVAELQGLQQRSEERRVGKEWRSARWTDHWQ